MILIWFRADLRTIDQPALTKACAYASEHQLPVMALYISSPAQWHLHDYGIARVDIECRHVHQLSEQLTALNIPLMYRDVPLYADIPTHLNAFCIENKVQAVFANRQYEVNEIARDRLCHKALREIGIEIDWSHDQCVVAPNTIFTKDPKTKQDKCYTVFTPFKKVALAVLNVSPITILPRPAPVEIIVKMRADEIPTHFGDFYFTEKQADLKQSLYKYFPAGEDVALSRLNDFCDAQILQYKTNRDFPAVSGTSALSPYLAVGAISGRQCYVNAERVLQQTGEDADVSCWISEILWRDFYRHIMNAFPHVGRGLPFQLDTKHIVWRNDDSEFQTWCDGRTGFPIVDSAMRCLNATGYMHNRLRMIVAMFLVKDLLIDWRWGEAYFARHLVDFDFCSNNGGWQWSASTGNDSVPYFRIFNPYLQSEKCDPNGDFIRQWLPELAHLSAKDIHNPYGAKKPVFVNYPKPIVDHAEARLRTLAVFKALRESAEEL